VSDRELFEAQCRSFGVTDAEAIEDLWQKAEEYEANREPGGLRRLSNEELRRAYGLPPKQEKVTRWPFRGNPFPHWGLLIKICLATAAFAIAVVAAMNTWPWFGTLLRPLLSLFPPW